MPFPYFLLLGAAAAGLFSSPSQGKGKDAAAPGSHVAIVSRTAYAASLFHRLPRRPAPAAPPPQGLPLQARFVGVAPSVSWERLGRPFASAGGLGASFIEGRRGPQDGLEVGESEFPPLLCVSAAAEGVKLLKGPPGLGDRNIVLLSFCTRERARQVPRGGCPAGISL